jgi:hypothetical protein
MVSMTRFAWKDRGGLATYPANHHPFAVYAPAVQKTFFCYGGSSKNPVPGLLHEVGYFDHRTGQVSRPTIVLDKGTGDAHDNPVLNIDRRGYIWLFSTSHGTERSSPIHRSWLPYDIRAFDRVAATRGSSRIAEAGTAACHSTIFRTCKATTGRTGDFSI